MQHANGMQVRLATRLPTQLMGRTDLLGKLATAIGARSPTRSSTPTPGSLRPQGRGEDHRRRRDAPASAVRHASASRPGSRSGARRCSIAKRQGKVAVFPTCLVEYQKPDIGKDLVKVYERNGIECSLPRARLLRRPVAARGRRREVHEGRREEHRGPGRRGARAAPTSSCRSRRAATSSRRTTSTTSAAPTPNSSPSTPTTPPST